MIMRRPIAFLVPTFLVICALAYYLFFSRDELELTMYKEFRRSQVTDIEYLTMVNTYNTCFEPSTRENYFNFIKLENREGLPEPLLRQRAEEVVEYAKINAMSLFDKSQGTGIARIKGKIVGIYTCYNEDKFLENTVMIYSLCLNPKYRGHGYGEELTEHAIKNCQVPGKNLALVVYKNNPVISLYKRLGFEIVPPGRIPKDPYETFNKYFMLYKKR